MAKEELKNIFLSASVPLSERDPIYFDTADIIAIRDAVVSLVTTILPSYRLVWGGHPSITPIINYVIEKLGLNVQKHVILYQTKYFEHVYPEDNNRFDNVIQTESTGERESSLLLMRETMFNSYTYSAGIFIGGMDGVDKEFQLFRNLQPSAELIPIASTGAAAKKIYDEMDFNNQRLQNDYAYSSLFTEYLINQ